jgi:hypothetical protein
MLVTLTWLLALGAAAREADAQVFKPRGGKSGKQAAAARKNTSAPTAVVSKKPTRGTSTNPGPRRIASPKATPARKGRAAAKVREEPDDVVIRDDDEGDEDVTIVDDD